MTSLNSLIILLLGLYFVRRLTQVPVTIQLTLVTKTKVESDEPPNPDAEMPQSVVDYIDQESDPWARSSRKQAARNLYAKSNDWNEVLIELRRQDLNG